MNELFFPIVGALVVFLVVIPGLTLLARTLIELRGEPNALAAHSRSWRLVLVVGPSLGPVIWLLSATAHQLEEGAPLSACAIDHLGGELCRDVLFFGALLLAALTLSVGRRWLRELRAVPARSCGHSSCQHARERVARLCRGSTALQPLASRVHVVEGSPHVACTRGLVSQVIEVDVRLISRLSDAELLAALLHEAAHAAGRDPLRFFVGQVALSLNPLRSLLEPEMARQLFAREAACDRAAVRSGADPLDLARSLVEAASPTPTSQAVAALGGHELAGVRLRIQLLLGYAAGGMGAAPSRVGFPFLLLSLVSIVAWPHLAGADGLDGLHHFIERAAPLLGLG